MIEPKRWFHMTKNIALFKLIPGFETVNFRMLLARYIEEL